MQKVLIYYESLCKDVEQYVEIIWENSKAFKKSRTWEYARNMGTVKSTKA